MKNRKNIQKYSKIYVKYGYIIFIFCYSVNLFLFSEIKKDTFVEVYYDGLE